MGSVAFEGAVVCIPPVSRTSIEVAARAMWTLRGRAQRCGALLPRHIAIDKRSIVRAARVAATPEVCVCCVRSLANGLKRQCVFFGD